jgi:GMP synthase-like glutamine amidotransferase
MHDAAPVWILQTHADDGPAAFGRWLDAVGIGRRVFPVAEPGGVPTRLAPGVRALAMLGGPMSVNDELPWLRAVERLMRSAIEAGVPVIGHCLGGQMLARCLGAKVADLPAPEIGWWPVELTEAGRAHAWLADWPQQPVVLQWHYQGFELPAGATLLAASAAAPRQAFACGPHLGMQFHIEIDADKLERWIDDGRAELALASRHPASVQDEAALRQATARHLDASLNLAARLYTRWCEGAGLRAA